MWENEEVNKFTFVSTLFGEKKIWDFDIIMSLLFPWILVDPFFLLFRIYAISLMTNLNTGCLLIFHFMRVAQFSRKISCEIGPYFPIFSLERCLISRFYLIQAIYWYFGEISINSSIIIQGYFLQKRDLDQDFL